MLYFFRFIFKLFWIKCVYIAFHLSLRIMFFFSIILVYLKIAKRLNYISSLFYSFLLYLKRVLSID